jgi:hypothetical protein
MSELKQKKIARDAKLASEAKAAAAAAVTEAKVFTEAIKQKAQSYEAEYEKVHSSRCFQRYSINFSHYYF